MQRPVSPSLLKYPVENCKPFIQCGLKKNRPNGAVWRCHRWFEDDSKKLCPYHRELGNIRAKRHQQTDKHKASRFKSRHSEHGKATSRLYEQTPKRKAWKRHWGKTDKGREKGRRNASSAIGKASRQRRKLMIALTSKVNKYMGLGTPHVSATVKEYTEFADADDLRQHLSTTLDTESGMTLQNHGSGHDKWHIGHRIAKAMYDRTNPVDIRRCWSKANIFAQWQLENLELAVKLPSDNELRRLIELQVAPLAWNNCVPGVEERARLEKRAKQGSRAY